MLKEKSIDTRGLQIKKGEKTFFWSGKYHNNMNSRETVETQLNVLDKQINNVKEKPTSTKKAKESLGNLWTNNDKYLSKTNKDKFRTEIIVRFCEKRL